MLFWLYITYYVKPKADYVSSRVDVTGANYQAEARFQNEILKNRLFNPAIVKLLPKVWVRKEMKVAAATLYRPEYEDVIDYAEKTNPVTAMEVKRQESERQAQRASIARQNHRNSHSNGTLSDAGSDFDGTSLSTGMYPPEQRVSHIVYMSDDGRSEILADNQGIPPRQQSHQQQQQYSCTPPQQQWQYQDRSGMQSSPSSQSLRQQHQMQSSTSSQSLRQQYQGDARPSSQLDPRYNSQVRDPRYNQQAYRPQYDGQPRQNPPRQ